VRLSREAWERRDEHEEGSPEHSASVAAGVVLAAHTGMFDTEYTAEDILADISEENIHSPEDSLYKYMTEGETDTTPEELRSRAEELEDEGDELGLSNTERLRRYSMRFRSERKRLRRRRHRDTTH
jgi:hypothetical protein